MEYPGSRISKPVRKTIMVIFIALFFIISPAIIMYTSGYRYDFKRGLLRETGAINIDIEPKDAVVTLNGIKIKSTMPVRLNDRIPGKYNVLISSPGYFDWRKEIEVKNKQTVYIKEISILKKNQPDFLTDGSIRSLSISYDGSFLAYIKLTSDGEELRVRNLDNQSEEIMHTFVGDKKMAFVWAPTNNYIAISNAEAPYDTLIIMNAGKTDKKIDVMAITQYPIDKYMWNETAAPELYFGTKLRLMSILPETEQKFILGKTNWLDWQMENGQLWTIQKSASTSQIRLVKDTLGFKSDFIDENMFLPTEQNLKILACSDNQILLKKNGKPEMLLLTKDKKFIFSGEQFKISKFNNWWLFWTPWEIWTYSKGGEPSLLNRSGEGLKEVLPLDQYNTLALIWDDKTTALYPYYLVTHDLVGASIISAAANTNNRVFYFSAKIGDKEGLWKLSY
ncbi:MAG: PEGA domain-containing protein [Candidatus Magasanikbacteria bacterium]|nr:PEGA domain-containing protein [Candidatus Magasanikbacteria bacterium]